MKPPYSIIGILALHAAPVAAQPYQPKVFGEFEIAYGQTEIDELDETVDSLTLEGAAAFVSPGGLGVQLGGGYASLDVEGSGEVDTYALDAHLYGDRGGYKIGVFVGHLEIDEVEIYGLGAADADTSTLSYGAEGQGRHGGIGYHGYIGQVDVDDTDNILYGVGAEFVVTPVLELTANYDAAKFSVDGDAEELEASTLTVGADYYLEQAPLRLSASIGRTNLEYDGEDADVTNFGIGATYLFGGDSGSGRERLFESLRLAL
ncbi:hypothetical protein [Limimaricola soesokkakensis]|uniref:hypothetical protein n=1 Tax=Limimaricola soesokkakensis TaxID=1343159 RepID=UPI003517CB88